MAEKKYQFDEEHKKTYDKMLNAVKIEDHVKKTIKHRDAWAPALEVLKGKEVAHIEEGIELLTDAIIKYRKAAGIPVSEEPEQRHYLISEIRGWLDNPQFKEALRGDPEKLLKEGNGHLILTQLLEMEKKRDLEGKLDYEMRKLLSPDKDFKFYHGIAHYHASLHPTQKFTKGDLAKMATRENILGNVKSLYGLQVEDKLKEYKPKKKK